jgi:hypothetical protein
MGVSPYLCPKSLLPRPLLRIPLTASPEEMKIHADAQLRVLL